MGEGAPSRFWENMSNELFENVLGIHEQIDAYLPLRSRGEGFPAIFVRTWPYDISLRYVQGKPTNQRFQRSSAYTSAGRWHLISGRHRSVSPLTYLPRMSILVLIADFQQTVCPHLASRAEPILYSSLNALTDLQYAWPMASKWQQALRKTTIPMAESSTQPQHADTSQERFENLTAIHYHPVFASDVTILWSPN